MTSTVLRMGRASRGESGVPFQFEDVAEQARRRLDEANAEAAQIIAAARNEADAIRRQAEEEGIAAARQGVEAAVRERVDRTNAACARLVSRVIAEDTGLTSDEATMLAAGLTGMAQTAARHWLREDSHLAKDDAARLVSTLGWRGISRIPLSHPPA